MGNATAQSTRHSLAPRAEDEEATMLGKLAAPVAAGAVMILALAGGAWGSRPPAGDETCEEVLQGPTAGGAHKVTDPPDGSTVAPGDDITVTITWDPATFDSPSVDKIFDCVTVDGHAASGLSTQGRDVPNDGRFITFFTLPADLPAGAQVCDRGLVGSVTGGDTFTRRTTNDVCLTTRGPVAPEAPVARSGPPETSTVPPPGAPPERRSETPPATPPETPSATPPAASPPTPSESPSEHPPNRPPADVSAPPPAPALPVDFPLPAAAPAVEAAPAPLPAASAAPVAPALPLTGTDARTLLAGAGADLVIAGLAVIAGTGRRRSLGRPLSRRPD
jgi:hypothetical protein